VETKEEIIIDIVHYMQINKKSKGIPCMLCKNKNKHERSEYLLLHTKQSFINHLRTHTKGDLMKLRNITRSQLEMFDKQFD